MATVTIVNQNPTLTGALTGGAPPGIGDTVIIHGTANNYPGETWANDIAILRFEPSFYGSVGPTALGLTCSAGTVTNASNSPLINLSGTSATAEIATLINRPANPTAMVNLSSGEFKTIQHFTGNLYIYGDCEAGVTGGVTIDGGTCTMAGITAAFAAPDVTVRGSGRLMLHRDVGTLTVDGPSAYAKVETITDGTTAPSPANLAIKNGGTCNYASGNSAAVALTHGGILDVTGANGIIAFGAITAVGPGNIVRYKSGCKPTFSGETVTAGTYDWIAV